MVQPVDVPGRGTLDFPDHMSREQIEHAIQGLVEFDKQKRQEMRATDSEIKDWSNTPTVPPPPEPSGLVNEQGVPINRDQRPPKKPIEYPDAPTTGNIVLPGINPFGKKDVEGNEALPVGSKLALQYGTLSTDSPKARQEMYVKHLPGAEAHDDKYGNPMIRYQGKLYYTSRPGEFDLMDAGRLTAGIAGTVPLVALAPASVPGLLVAGAATGAGQSVLEDLVAKASGGESLPWVDVEKALWSGAFGAAFPALLKGAPAVAGRLNELIKRGQPLTDDALRALGLTSDQIETISPEIRTKLKVVADRSFNDPKAVGGTYRKELMEEFAPGTSLTKGEISGDAAQIAREQTLAGRSDVPGRANASAQIMANRETQDAALNEAQERLRAQVGTGSPMDPSQAGTILKQQAKAADKTAKEATDLLYDKTRNPFLMTQDGIPVAAPKEAVGGVSQVVRSGVEANSKVSNVLTKEGAELAPQAAAALKQLDDFSASTARRTSLATTREMPTQISSPAVRGPQPEGLLAEQLPPGEVLPPGTTSTRWAMDQPRELSIPAQPPTPESLLSSTVNQTPPGGPRITGPSPTGKSNIPGEVDWEAVISQRKLLTDRMDAAVSAGNRTDQAAMKEIIDSFDSHFGPLNPNLEPARAAHAERMERFKPGGSPAQDRMTEAALEVLQGPEGGAKVVNTIFGPGLKKGEATQMIEHLNTRVFNDHPEARAVLKEQALRRLTVDADGKALTPKATVTAIEKAFGDQQGELYAKLFTSDELKKLRRFQELMKTISNSRDMINPPNTALITQAVLNMKTAENMGAAAGAGIGGTIGGILGLPGGAGGSLGGGGVGAVIGGGIGRFVGRAVDAALPPLRAAAAVRPPPGYTGAATSRLPGLLGRPAGEAATEAGMPGPADRLMNDLLR